MHSTGPSWFLLTVLALGIPTGCDSSEPEQKPQPEAQPQAEAAKPEPPAEAAYSEPHAHPNEACFKVVVVAHTEIDEPPEGITRDKVAAKARADELRAGLSGDADFVAFAQIGGILGN